VLWLLSSSNMFDIKLTEHLSISRLEKSAKFAGFMEQTENVHLSACAHCQHIRHFFSDDYAGRFLAGDGQKKLQDFDKTA
jgi:hypothetical protein